MTHDSQSEMANSEIVQPDEFADPVTKFRTRASEINVLSTDENGLQFESGELLPRPDAKKMLLAQGKYGEDILEAVIKDISTREVTSSLKTAIKESFEMGDEKARIDLMRELGVSEEIIENFIKEAQARKLEHPEYLSGQDRVRYAREYEKTNKLGMFDIQVSKDGKRVKANIRKVPFVFYKHIRKPQDEASGLIELANPTGVAVVIETSDGYFGLGRRGPKNGTYRASDEGGGQPGAFAAGIMDMNFSRLTAPGLPEKLQNSKILRAADQELKEETGVRYLGKQFQDQVKNYAIDNMKRETGFRDPEASSLDARIKITSIGRDKVQPHNEIGVTLQVPVSRQDLIDIHSNMERNESEKDFSEGIFFIPATKEAVTKFITQSKSPMPPTHYMPLISAMYEKIVTSGADKALAIQEADEWLAEIEEGLDKNWAEIDRIVEQFYIDNPEAIEENQAESGRKDINTKGFDPAVLADKQGLPTLNTELVVLDFPQN